MVLFNVRLLSELPLAVATAERLVARGEQVTFTVETDDGQLLERLEKEAVSLNAPCISLATRIKQAVARGTGVTDRLRSWMRSAEDRALDESPRGKAFLAALGQELAASRSVINDVKPDLLVVFQDGVSANHALIRAAKDDGVPIVDCPYGSGSTSDFDDYLDEKAAENNLNIVDDAFGGRVKRDYPHWVRAYRGREVLMFPPEYVLVRERLQLGLPLPWVIHGGIADLLAAESETMRRRYLDEGIAPAKVELTGTVYCDVMHDQLSQRPDCEAAFKRAGKVRAGVTSVLVSLPPSLHGVRAQNSEFPTYEDACRAIAAMFTGQRDLDAIVSLHPNAPVEQRRFIESLGLQVSDEWILRLIPRYDVFFTTFSSTIRWAIACGKPVLNYNMYGYDNHDYDAVAGVFTHQRLAEISGLLSMLKDDSEYQRIASQQKNEGDAWGMMDGRNFDRIHSAIDRLRQARGVRSSR